MNNDSLDSILNKIPSDINLLILSFIYDNEGTIKKYFDRWKIKNRKQLVIVDKINIPQYKHCTYFLTLKDYNDFPCWYCKGIHTLRICVPFMKDISNINKIFNKL